MLQPSAALTLAGDGIKGFLAVFLAQTLGSSFGVAEWTVAAVALAVFVGHIFPVFHRFAGGKGVATSAGILFALHWPLALGLAALWIVMAVGFKISSLAALTTATLAPIGAFLAFGNSPTAWAVVAISLLLFWRHQSNIRQLLAGSELRFEVRLKDAAPLIRGRGVVAWTRWQDQGPRRPAGMGVRFVELDAESRELIYKVVDERL